MASYLGGIPSGSSSASSYPWGYDVGLNKSSFWKIGAVPNKYAFRSPPPFAKGYFAIPPTDEPSQNTRSFFTSTPPEEPQDEPEHEDDAYQEPSTPEPESPSPEERQKEEARLKRLEQERAIAEAGEIDWVRSGGILRDADGNRDLTRTNAIREELHLQAEEKRLREQWDTYQKRWQAIASSQEPLHFKDIPWPLPVAPGSVEEMTQEKIEDFIMSPLKIRGNKVTPKGRLRGSMLRWHPDKLGAVVARVVPEELEDVKEGVGVVFRCLKALQDKQVPG
ncbi:hypothetical protein OE88DRAFT_1663027 [Heliocybe sulcata]|uniref:Uncharacterized protein n=1 Tax=Heliocybe sulcata TaxID=5364 RepID=A0A5C3N070_9AGAM|nr:hypothetical protein OE88DRAFT_1663027 [Heliocybe sulcata]